MEQTTSGMEGSCGYVELAVGVKRQGVMLQLGDWMKGSRRNVACYKMSHRVLGLDALFARLKLREDGHEILNLMSGACIGQVH
jgi:hypothetical protein